MKNKLPSDLREAESNVYESIQSYFLSNSSIIFEKIKDNMQTSNNNEEAIKN